jgi:hypothetical protein
MIDDLCDSGCWKDYKLKIFVFEIGVKKVRKFKSNKKSFCLIKREKFGLYKGVFFLFVVEVDVEESIVNEPFVLKHWFFALQIKNTNKTKSEVRFKQLIIKKTDFSNCILKTRKNEVTTAKRHPLYKSKAIANTEITEKSIVFLLTHYH